MRLTTPRHLNSRLISLGLFAGVFGALLWLGAAASPQPADAQDTAPSDWAPFIGEYSIGCTRSTGGPGPCGGHHNGWAMDITLGHNTPVYAAGAGVVAWTEDGCSPTGGDPGCNSSAGNYVAVDHGDRYSRYLHLASFAEGIEVGAPIAAGQLIGFTGSSGTNGGDEAHLHYDELAYPLSATQRIAFGPMLTCQGGQVVQYPDALGTTDWQQVPFGTVLRNDGYDCLGGVTPEPLPPPPPPPPPPPIEPSPGGSVGLAFGDFNNDGRADLVIGVPGEAIGKRDEAGTSSITYGSSRGPSSRTETLRQRRGLKGKAEAGDLVGSAIARGDFDCDGFDDVAIGAPGEDVGGVVNTGAVNVAYGGRNDTNNRGVIFYQGKWLGGTKDAGDLTGAALASGDFDNDGCDDLAVGAPGEDIDSFIDAGAVLVIYGRSGGFGPDSRISGPLYQGSGLAGLPETGDLLGATLTSGDFNCDGSDDLAIGVPLESIDFATNAGAVSVIYGGSDGLKESTEPLFQSDGIAGILESGDYVGAALANGDFNNDGCDDLAVGAPGEDLDGGREAGAVSVVFGSTSGLGTSTVHFQETGGFPGKVESGDVFGAAVAAGDLNCDGYDDLVVGVPGEDIAGRSNTGWVGVLYGSGTGMSTTSTALYQKRGGLPGGNEPNDQLGASLATGDIDGDGCDDLAIGSPGEGIGTRALAGRVLVVMGSTNGRGAVTSHSQARNLPGGSEPGDLLGGPGVLELLGLSLH